MSHRSTLFSQTLSLIPKHVFQKREHRHKTGRCSRIFGFKEQFTVLAFIQLAARRSLRDAVRSLSAVPGRLHHCDLKTWRALLWPMPTTPGPWAFFGTCSLICTVCEWRKSRTTRAASSPSYSASTQTASSLPVSFSLGLVPRGSGGIKMPVVLHH